MGDALAVQGGGIGSGAGHAHSRYTPSLRARLGPCRLCKGPRCALCTRSSGTWGPDGAAGGGFGGLGGLGAHCAGMVGGTGASAAASGLGGRDVLTSADNNCPTIVALASMTSCKASIAAVELGQMSNVRCACSVPSQGTCEQESRLQTPGPLWWQWPVSQGGSLLV